MRSQYCYEMRANCVVILLHAHAYKNAKLIACDPYAWKKVSQKKLNSDQQYIYLFSYLQRTRTICISIREKQKQENEDKHASIFTSYFWVAFVALVGWLVGCLRV